MSDTSRTREPFNGSWQRWLALSALSTAGLVACGSSATPSNGVGGSGGSSATSGSTTLPMGGAPAGGAIQEAGGAPVVAAGSGGSAETGGPSGGAFGSAGSSGASGASGASGSGGMAATDPGTDGDGIVMIAAPFKAAPEMTDAPGVAKGQTIQFQMGNSTTFGDGGRAAAVYLPAGYTSGTEIPFMVAQDGLGFSGDVRPMLDNMIADGRLPAMAFVFADPAGNRSVEYDTASDKYYKFVETELLPAAIAQAMMKANVVLNLTKNPEGRGTYGGSSGGAAAFTMGWFHPESYRRILTISGSFVNLQRTPPDYPNGCADYYMTEVPNSVPNVTPNKPLRVFIEAGSNDLNSPTWRNANDSMGKAFAAKGYHYRYVEAQGAVHEDEGARHQYLPDAMLWLWRGYTKP
ncbi:MAG TPA: alpha/beta hydrolase-fold protein [Polyangiaceae bacterium]|nr:alpha/beta hydrolase-fold protein [Polyangiaceae bacterium]